MATTKAITANKSSKATSYPKNHDGAKCENDIVLF